MKTESPAAAFRELRANFNILIFVSIIISAESYEYSKVIYQYKGQDTHYVNGLRS